MRYRKELVVPMSGLEAANRAINVLGKWRYRNWAIPGGIRFERSFPLSGLFVVQPHHVHSRIDMMISETARNGCEVTLIQNVYKFGQPSSRLDKIVWEGDLLDVEASLMRREEPQIDRTRQNAHAGRMTGVYIASILVPILMIGIAFGLSRFLEGAILAIGLLIIAAIALPFVPFHMPEFPLENALPPAPGGSNYLRDPKS